MLGKLLFRVVLGDANSNLDPRLNSYLLEPESNLLITYVGGRVSCLHRIRSWETLLVPH